MAAPDQGQSCQVRTAPLDVMKAADDEFTLDNMTRQTASLSPDSDRLVLGGSLAFGEQVGQAAIAQVSLAAHGSVDFARRYALASTISSVAYVPFPSSMARTDTQIVALATQDFTEDSAKAYILVLGATGEMLQAPITVSMEAFAGAGEASLALSSLLFDKHSRRVISALSHENRQDLAQMVTIDLQESARIIKSWTFEEFMLSSGDQSATMNVEAERVYLAGESDQRAHIAAIPLSNGEPTGQHELFKVDFDISVGGDDDSISAVTHILYEEGALFGAAEIHKRFGDAPQIAVWSLDLTPEGQPAHGAFSSVLAPAASVTSVQAGASRDTLRLVVQTTDANEQLYVVFDLASGTVRSASQLLTSTVTFGPVISLLGSSDEALLVPAKSTTYSTSQSYRFFYTRFE